MKKGNKRTGKWRGRSLKKSKERPGNENWRIENRKREKKQKEEEATERKRKEWGKVNELKNNKIIRKE